jgi:Tfp pilus assembly protein PilF
MSAILAIAGLLVTAAPAPPIQSVDAAYDEVRAAQNAAAIARIEDDGPAAHAHPAQLINLGIAYAREGKVDQARVLLQRAANAEELYSLETASGAWTNSRVLAQRALASLESGRLGKPTRSARR